MRALSRGGVCPKSIAGAPRRQSAIDHVAKRVRAGRPEGESVGRTKPLRWGRNPPTSRAEVPSSSSMPDSGPRCRLRLEFDRSAGGIYRPGTAVQPCGTLTVPQSYDSPSPIVKIINRYVLKEHIGPFVFALSALTSLLLLQYIARKFGDLVGRGLSWQVITEFMLLSIPFTVAMTLPMSVLVAVLFAFSRMASENEITALKAGGISTRRLMVPALVASTLVAFFMLWFNDQVLSRANH